MLESISPTKLKVIRRIGGLEIGLTDSEDNAVVIRRIGGLEMSIFRLAVGLRRYPPHRRFRNM